MNIELSDIGKRFQKDWIFKKLNYRFESHYRYAITGSNGSGKSTLIQILTAAEHPTVGKIEYFDTKGKRVQTEEVYKSLCFAAPYVDLPEELTAMEVVEFHSHFKNLGVDQCMGLLEEVGLANAKDKFVKDFSSGMKQRLKLGLAICSEAPLLLLDEPCSNLDRAGIAIYHNLLDAYGKSKLIIIGSNANNDELYKVDKTLSVHRYKTEINQ